MRVSCMLSLLLLFQIDNEYVEYNVFSLFFCKCLFFFSLSLPPSLVADFMTKTGEVYSERKPIQQFMKDFIACGYNIIS